MSYEITNLGEYINVQGGYAFKSKDFSKDGNPVLKIKNVRFGHIDFTDCGFVSDLVINGLERFKTNSGDILISMTGSGPNAPQSLVGRVAKVYQDDKAAYINQRVGRIQIKDNKVDPDFIFYLLQQKSSINYLVANSTGSANQANINAATICSVPCPKVTFEESVAIADILRNIDLGIRNNSQMNTTLEKIAQRIFKSWFVDFDPVKANAEGVPFDGLSPEIQALFPNEFEESELGMIPKGWEVKSLDEIAHFLNGLACQKHRPKDGETPLPVIKIAEMRAGYQEKTNEASPNVDPKYIIQDGDFLFSWSGSLTTCFWSHGPGVLNQHLFKVTSEDYPKWFFSMWVNVHLAEFIRIAADKATTMGHIKREHLSQAKVVVPNLEDLMSKGNDIFGPLIERSNLCLTQAKTLMKVRDKLLPRLISGKITIQKAEELLEEAS